MRLVAAAVFGLALSHHAAAFLPGAQSWLPRRAPARIAQPQKAISCARLRPSRSVGAIRMTAEVKTGLAEPSPEVLQQALANAEEVLKAAGGCIDSLSFGREWREMFPDFDRSAFKGTPITSFNKLLSLYGGDTFSVEATKKKEVKLYILKDAAGAEGKESYLEAEKKLQELADSPLGAFFDIRGGRMRAGGARALPPNLSSYTKLDELLDVLEPNLVAFAGGVSVVSAKDAVTALNNIKRLQYQARWPVQQSRAESFVRVFVEIATRGIGSMSTKSIALLLNAIQAFSSDKLQCSKTMEAASLRIQTLATQMKLLQSLPVLGGETESDEVFRAQAVAVIVTAYQRMGRREDELFKSLAGVVTMLPPEDFDAQALANIANAYVDSGVEDAEMFDKLADVSATLTADRWNPTAIALVVEAMVNVGKTETKEDKALLHMLAEMQCTLYSQSGERVFSSPGNLAKLLSSLARAQVLHVRLFTCAAVVVAQHIKLSAQPETASNILMPQEAKTRAKGNKKKKGGLDRKSLAAKKFMDQATGADLALLAAALQSAGTLTASSDLAGDLIEETRRRGLPPKNIPAIAAAITAFGPLAASNAKAQELLSVSLNLVPPAALSSAGPIGLILQAMLHAEWKDGATAARIVEAICRLDPREMSADDKGALHQSLVDLNMPRHLSPALAHLADS